MRPGPNATTSTATIPSLGQVNTGTWFTVGAASQGPTTPVLISSFAQFLRVFGPRGTYSATYYDAIEAFFQEGGSRCYVCRVVGPTAKNAEAKLKDSLAAASVTVESLGAGIWANGFKLVVVGTEAAYTITVQNAAGEILEISPVLTNNADAVAFGKVSAYVTVTSTGTKSPAPGTFELTAGTDNTAGIITSVYEAGLKRFGPEYGPGQLSVPGVSSTAVIEATFRIAGEQGRKAVSDQANKATKAELVTQAVAIRALGPVARAGALFGDWQQASPVSGTITPRAVPLSAYVAAKAAVIDAKGNPNLPIAGKQAILSNSLGKENAFTETEVEELYLAGVNVTKLVGGQVRIYGNRTPVNPQTDPLYVQFSNCRLDMAILWRGLAIEEDFMFTQEDGEGNDAADYANALSGMLLPYYTRGALFGKGPSDAFRVDAGTDVNTLATEEEGNLNANIAYRRSKGADQVNQNITRVAITQEV